MIDENIPRHIGIILDGNRRWAKAHGLDPNEGHIQGAKTAKKIIKYAYEKNIEYLTLYVFSTENWKRDEKEVSLLMKLLKEYLDNMLSSIDNMDIKVKVYGDISILDMPLRLAITSLEKKTCNNSKMVLSICLNYGGRQEILNAVKSIAKDVKEDIIKIEDITESLISDRLYTTSVPDPDFIIRTSNEQRLSNFLTYQSAYSELYFPKDIMWPDFDEKAFDDALEEYKSRNRRYGK